MITIPWKAQNANQTCFFADIGDLRVILKKRTEYWQLSIGIRAYSPNGLQSMVRPASNIIKFENCTDTQAKELACNYIEKFISGILSDISQQ